MKPLRIVFCSLLTAVLLAAGFDCSASAGRYQKGGQDSDATWLVVSSGFAGHVRGGRHVYRCSGTNDEVEIQAAIDACAAAGGGIVKLTPGAFNVSKPTGSTDVVFTADITDGVGEATLTNFSYTAPATSADLAIGQLYRISGGTDGGGDSVEDNVHDAIVTMTAITPAVKIGEDMAENYTTCTFVRLIGCIQLKHEVYVEGSGVDTIIRLAVDQNCDVVHFEGAATTVGFGMSNLLIDGRSASQGDHSTSTFHPECNGIVLNTHGWDAHFEAMVVNNCKGDGWWIDNPWGFHLYGGGWTEFISGSGICVGGGSEGRITNHKIASVAVATDRDEHASNDCVGDDAVINPAAIKLFKPQYFDIRGCDIRPTTGWGILANRALYMRASDNKITTSTSGGVNLLATTRAVITGNHIISIGSGEIGIRVHGYGATITGNHFPAAVAGTPIDIATGGGTLYGNYRNNTNAWIADANASVTRCPGEMWCEEMMNTSGAGINVGDFVVTNTYSGSVKVAPASTTATDVVGMLTATTADGVAGVVQIHGYHDSARIDDTVARAIAVGDELCVSSETAGRLEEAASGDWVVAIAEEAYAGAGGGTFQYRGVYILPPGLRYAAP